MSQKRLRFLMRRSQTVLRHEEHIFKAANAS
ncbi:hypothetical protein KP1_4067 [Klebsiella pneumoniae subsp. pneumoniae NTUH-K2044]|nr:hypothetical protein KP1_4067 [Klebsiella pneumoniae subsp. pneumoniae NTUH-K2044]